MSFIDIFRIKKFKNQIADLQNTIKLLEINFNSDALNLKNEILSLQSQINDFENNALYDENRKILDSKKVLFDLNNVIDEKLALLENLKKELEDMNQTKVSLSKDIIKINDDILLQSFGIYKWKYEFEDVAGYKIRLDSIKENIQQHIFSEKVVFYEENEKFTKREQKKMAKILVRCFNLECETAINSVKYNNVDEMENKIEKAYNLLNKYAEDFWISISDKYKQLYLEKLFLTYEFQETKKKKKEEARYIREAAKEELRVLEEIEKKRTELYKEQCHYQNMLKNSKLQLEQNINESKLKMIKDHINDYIENLKEIDITLEDLAKREANKKVGYVYIISNIGAFGENVYKIGMTRRLEPQDRIDELSNASVPFKYDVHAMIPSNDAPQLEMHFHKLFENERVNLMNNRKEFFTIPLEKIKRAVEDQGEQFIIFPPAQQYRETLMKRKMEK